MNARLTTPRAARAERNLFRRFAFLCAALVTAIPALLPAKPADLFRLGFSSSMLAGVNDNDARASLRALSAVVSRERRINADPEPLLFNGADAVADAVLAAEVDAVAITVDEYWALGSRVRFSRFLLGTIDGDPADTYLLVVRRDRQLSDLAALRQHTLAVHGTPRMRLGYLWLEVALARDSAPPAEEFFSRVFRTSKLSKAVLDVFFKRADACLVTQRGLAAMAELNPQIARQLVPIASSPSLVPSFFGFRAGMQPAFLETLVHQLGTVQNTPAGKQAVTIFQVGDLGEFPAETLQPALDLLDEYRARRPAEAARLIESLRASAAGPIGGAML